MAGSKWFCQVCKTWIDLQGRSSSEKGACMKRHKQACHKSMPLVDAELDAEFGWMKELFTDA